jgi:arylformamidase
MQRLKHFFVRVIMVVFATMTLSSCEQVYSAGHKIKNRLRYIVKDIIEDDPKGAAVHIPMVAGVKIIKDFIYGPHKKQRMDIYTSENAHNAPVIMMLHGGGWTGGNKEDQLSYINKVNRWVPKGFIVISVDTRLLPEADVYTQINDLAMSIVEVQRHAAEWGGDGDKLILMGHSSAATMVSVLAANPTIVTKLGGKKWLASFLLDSTSLDIPRSMRLWSPEPIVRAYGGVPERWLAASPINLLSNESIPMLIACSTQRADGPCEQAELFEISAKKFGITTKVISLEFDHGGVDFNLGLDAEYTNKAEIFMASLDSEVSRLLNLTNAN